jgi:hypothetical protein
MTKAEKKVAEWMENNRLNVVKGSFPDFFVSTKAHEFCFVEVKTYSDTPSYAQSMTFKAMADVGIPVIIVNAQSVENLSAYRIMLNTARIPDRTRKKFSKPISIP